MNVIISLVWKERRIEGEEFDILKEQRKITKPNNNKKGSERKRGLKEGGQKIERKLKREKIKRTKTENKRKH